MHEMSLSESVVRIIEDQAAQQPFTRVLAIHLEIGALSHADPDSLITCIGIVARGTVAEGAKILVERPPGRSWCWTCSKEVDVATLHDPCPDCGGHQLKVVSGDDLRVKELEVE